jgi:hypothetical protein
MDLCFWACMPTGRADDQAMNKDSERALPKRNYRLSERLWALPGKIRERGAGWLWQRLRREVVVPTTPATEAVRDRLATVHGWVRRSAGACADDLLPAVYDLDVNPITFDFSWFLIGAEMAARHAGKAGFRLIVVPGTRDGLREEIAEYDRLVDATNRRWRIDNLLLPLAGLSPACNAVVVCASRAEAEVHIAAAKALYPPHYSTLFPRAFDYADFVKIADRPGCFSGLKAPLQGRRYLEDWLDRHVRGRRLITATLRSYNYQPSRNSDLAAWSRFLRNLDRSLYAPVIVPDTNQAFEQMAEFVDVPAMGEAAWNIGLRMALYEMAYANLFVNNGPATLAQLNPSCNYLFTKIIVPDCEQASEEFLRERGFIPGQSPRFATATQIWWWHDDTVVHLERGFHALVERIETGGRQAGDQGTA